MNFTKVYSGLTGAAISFGSSLTLAGTFVATGDEKFIYAAAAVTAGGALSAFYAIYKLERGENLGVYQR